MAMVYGKEVQVPLINIKENILMIKNVDMEYLLGPPEMFTKGITLKI